MGQVTELIAEVDRVTGNEADRSQSYGEALQGYERAAATLNTLIVNGAFYCDQADHDRLWFKAMERLASRPQESGRAHAELHRYPVTLALYALGLGALAANRVKPLVDVIRDVKVLNPSQGLLAIAEGATSWEVLDPEQLNPGQPAPYPERPIWRCRIANQEWFAIMEPSTSTNLGKPPWPAPRSTPAMRCCSNFRARTIETTTAPRHGPVTARS
ncbi:MAG: hypothetical protein ACSLE8_18305 [Rhodococcus sp. (in: high G+C Gram-positive bacteria)]